MKLWSAGAAALLATAASGLRAQEPAPVPSATVNYTARAPKLDGRLDDPCWNAATALPLQWTWDGKPATEPATARLAFDDRYVYVAVDAPDQTLVAARESRDGDLYSQDDIIEFLLWPREDQPYYYRVAINPRGTVLDVFYISDTTQTKPALALTAWNPEIIGQVKAAVGQVYRPDKPTVTTLNGRWLVEIGLPLTAFTTRGLEPPANGEVWRVQFNRYNRPTLEGAPTDITCWSPYYEFGWPHVLGRFGRVSLAGAPPRVKSEVRSALPEVNLLKEPPTGAAAAAPTAPVEPAPVETAPVAPVTPVEPAPVTPAAPVEPAPVTPAAPVEPAPVAPVAPVEPAPVTPAAPVEPAPVTPAAPVEPTPAEPAPGAEKTLSLSINDAPLPDALRVLFRGTDFTYALEPTLAAAPPRVTLSVENVSWADALSKLVDVAGLEYAKTGSTYTFSRKAPPPSGAAAPGGPLPG